MRFFIKKKKKEECNNLFLMTKYRLIFVIRILENYSWHNFFPVTTIIISRLADSVKLKSLIQIRVISLVRRTLNLMGTGWSWPFLDHVDPLRSELSN